jgi:predicted dehydrogenase
MKICFFGFGRRGKTLYGHLASLPDVSVAGIFDPISTYSYPAQYYRDTRTMLAECEPDLVIDASPPKYRFKNILLCNEFMVPIVCEKPLLFSAKELSTLKRVKISVYPAYQLNFDAEIRKFFELAEEGSIRSVTLSQQVNLNASGWKINPAISGGGTLSDNGAHLINLSAKHFGLPHSVFATISMKRQGVDSIADALLWYGNFIVKIGVSWHSPVGKETALTIATDSKSIYFIETNKEKSLRVSFADAEGKWTRRIDEHWYASRGLDRNLKVDPFNKMQRGATRCMLEAIIQDVSTHGKRRSPMAANEFRTALQTSRVIEALYSSVKRARRVSL